MLQAWNVDPRFRSGTGNSSSVLPVANLFPTTKRILSWVVYSYSSPRKHPWNLKENPRDHKKLSGAADWIDDACVPAVKALAHIWVYILDTIVQWPLTVQSEDKQMTRRGKYEQSCILYLPTGLESFSAHRRSSLNVDSFPSYCSACQTWDDIKSSLYTSIHPVQRNSLPCCMLIAASQLVKGISNAGDKAWIGSDLQSPTSSMATT